MSKQEFLAQLRKGLSGLPKEDLEERLTFYSEMIDDRIDDGMAEEEAVVIAEYFDVLGPETPVEPNVLYRVQAGAFRVKANAVPIFVITLLIVRCRVQD